MPPEHSRSDQTEDMMGPMDSPSSVYSQSTNGGSPRSARSSSPLSAVYQEEWEQLSRLTSRNSYEFARLRAQLKELNNRVDAMDSPLRSQLESVNARAEQLAQQVASKRQPAESQEAGPSHSQPPISLLLERPVFPPPRSSSLPTGVLYVPSAGPPAAGRVQRLARERGMRMLRTSESTSPLYRLPRNRRPYE